MNKFEKPEDFNKTKEEINKEGFEERAAVLIGKKEEMDRLLEKLETEGKTEDLGTYIRLHKEIVLPNEEILNQEVKADLLKTKGCFFELQCRDFVGKTEEKKLLYNLKYIDKDGNLAETNLFINDIADLKTKIIDEKIYHIDNQERIIKNELLKLGFKSWYESYSEEELKEAEESAKKDIDNDSRPGYPLSRMDKTEIEKRFKERIKERLNYYIREPKLQKILEAQKAYKERLEEKSKTAKKEGFDF